MEQVDDSDFSNNEEQSPKGNDDDSDSEFWEEIDDVVNVTAESINRATFVKYSDASPRKFGEASPLRNPNLDNKFVSPTTF